MSDSDDISSYFEKKPIETAPIQVNSYKPPKKMTNKNDNFISMGISGVQEFRFKPYILLFLIFIIITCNVFVDKCLSQFSDAVYGNEPTTKGTVIQGIFLTMTYIVVDYLCQYEYI